MITTSAIFRLQLASVMRDGSSPEYWAICFAGDWPKPQTAKHPTIISATSSFEICDFSRAFVSAIVPSCTADREASFPLNLPTGVLTADIMYGSFKWMHDEYLLIQVTDIFDWKVKFHILPEVKKWVYILYGWLLLLLEFVKLSLLNFG